MSAEQKKKWSCQECLRSKPRNNANNTPVRGLTDSNASPKTCEAENSDASSSSETASFVTKRSTHRQVKSAPIGHATDESDLLEFPDVPQQSHDSGHKVGLIRKISDGTESEISRLTEQLRMLTNELTSVKTKLVDLTQSLSFTNERMDDMVGTLATVNDRLSHLEKRDVEFHALQNTVTHLQIELEAHAQLQLRNEIEIVGIPESNGENLYHTVLVAAKLVGVELDDKEVDWVDRAGPRRPPITAALPEDGAKLPRPVVVRFLRRSKRDSFLKAAKSRKNVTSLELGVHGTSRQVYFNERLTKRNRGLFRDARTRARQLGYQFCWCSQGAIHVRKQEGKPAVLIRSHQDLERLLPIPSSLLSVPVLQPTPSSI